MRWKECLCEGFRLYEIDSLNRVGFHGVQKKRLVDGKGYEGLIKIGFGASESK